MNSPVVRQCGNNGNKLLNIIFRNHKNFLPVNEKALQNDILIPEG